MFWLLACSPSPTLVAHTVHLDPDGRVLRQLLDEGADGTVDREFVTRWDSDGRIKSETRLFAGSGPTDVFVWTGDTVAVVGTTLTVDPEGRPVSQHLRGGTVNRWVWRGGHLRRFEHTNSLTATVRTYSVDPISRTIGWVLTESGRHMSEGSCRYDARGFLVDRVVDTSGVGTAVSHTSWTRRDDGNWTTETTDLGPGTQLVRTRSYDAAGTLLEEVGERNGRVEERITWSVASNPSGRPFVPASSDNARPMLPVPVPGYCADWPGAAAP